MPKTIQLAKPMTVNGKAGAEEVTALEFRDPTALDLRRLGQPFKIFLHPDKRQEYEVNYDVLFRWFGHLSGRGSDDVAAAITLAQTDELKEWLSDELAVGRDEKKLRSAIQALVFEWGALSAVEADALPLTDIGHWIGMLQDWHEAKSRRERRARG